MARERASDGKEPVMASMLGITMGKQGGEFKGRKEDGRNYSSKLILFLKPRMAMYKIGENEKSFSS